MRLFKMILVLMILTIIASCSNETEPEESEEGEEITEEQLKGYVLHIENRRFLMIDNEDESVYKELENLTIEEMLNENPETPLVYVNYSKNDELNEGDRIIVDYDGVMTFSIPGQINASKVTKVE